MEEYVKISRQTYDEFKNNELAFEKIVEGEIFSYYIESGHFGHKITFHCVNESEILESLEKKQETIDEKDKDIKTLKLKIEEIQKAKIPPRKEEKQNKFWKWILRK